MALDSQPHFATDIIWLIEVIFEEKSLIGRHGRN